MHDHPSEEYDRYLTRCALTSSDPLPRDEFEILLRRLDDLYLTDVERHLTLEERHRLEELRCLLEEDLEDAGRTEDADPLDSLFPPPRTGGPSPRTSRMGSPCPDASSRRAVWRHQRRRTGNT